MGADVSVIWNGNKLDRVLLDRARPVLARGIGEGLDRSARFWNRAMQKRFRRGAARSNRTPGTINRRTGFLARSIGFRVRSGSSSRLADVRMILFSAGANYANVQEFGGTIRPRRSKYLAIPGKANLSASGVPRKPSARAWWDEFEKTGEIAVVKSKRTPGNRVVLWRRTRRSKWQHWWTLAKEVTVPGPESTGDPSNFGFYDTWAKQAKERADLVRHHAQKRVNAAGLKRYIDANKLELV